MTAEPEPTGWELMRRMDDLRRSVDAIGGKVVSVEVFTETQRGTDQRFQRLESRTRDMEAATADAEKQRRATRLAVSLGVLSPIVSVAALIVTIVLAVIR